MLPDGGCTLIEAAFLVQLVPDLTCTRTMTLEHSFNFLGLNCFICKTKTCYIIFKHVLHYLTVNGLSASLYSSYQSI